MAHIVEDLGIFFIPLFFILAGAGVNLNLIFSGNFLLIAILSLGAIVTKLVGCTIPARFFLKDKEKGLRVGYGMISRGEIGLVVSSIGLTYGLVSETIYTALIAVIFITTLITPFLLKHSYNQNAS